jgi:putative ABC transport system permease protein
MDWLTSAVGEFREASGEAVYSLRAHKLRSALTVLGVVIGVSTLIGISSVINGLNRNVVASVEQIGTNVLFVNKFNWARLSHPTSEEWARPDLTYEDGLALRQVPHVVAAAPGQRIFNPMFGFGTFTVRSRFGKAGNTALDGELPDAQEIFNINMDEGRWLNQIDQQQRRLVAALGYETAQDLFPRGGAVGSEIFVESRAFTVIGVVQKWKSPFTAGKNPDDHVVWMPLSSFRKLHPEHKEFWLYAKVDSPENVPRVIDSIRDLLRRRRGLRPEEEDNFAVMTPDALTDLWKQISGGFFILMFAVSSVGLLVGGIGVMNIMLMSVTERTHEIGVRKAMGATRNDILRQFVLEAMVLTCLGGGLGILFGAGIAWGIRTLSVGLPATMTLFWAACAFGVSATIGLFFGIYPAWKAAQLDPVFALRYE